MIRWGARIPCLFPYLDRVAGRGIPDRAPPRVSRGHGGSKCFNPSICRSWRTYHPIYRTRLHVQYYIMKARLPLEATKGPYTGRGRLSSAHEPALHAMNTDHLSIHSSSRETAATLAIYRGYPISHAYHLPGQPSGHLYAPVSLGDGRGPPGQR